MRIAIEGCCHGELDEIYKSIAQRERNGGFKVDLLLICGDFQAIRNEADLEAMSVPRKFLQLGTFHKYYSGEQRAPIPTVFIGGNHESSSYLWELYHGGWVCPNIYFLGWGNVINVGGLRIGGMSGIFKSGHYDKGHYEIAPLNDNHKRSIYHIRMFDVFKMLQVKEPLDVFLSHDWPRGIEQFGNVDGLIRIKPFFREEIKRNELGSMAFEQVLYALKPARWFSAHLHVKFTATVPWTNSDRHQLASSFASPPLANLDEIKVDFEDDAGNTVDGSAPSASSTPAGDVSNPDEIPIDFDDEDESAPTLASSSTLPAVSSNPDEISIDDDDLDGSTEAQTMSESTAPPPAAETTATAAATSEALSASRPLRRHPKETQFLALDKCLPKRQFLEIIDFPEIDEPIVFRYDQEWLAIVRTLDKYMSLQHHQPPAPEGKRLARELDENRRWVQENITGDKLLIPSNFVQTTPPHNPIYTLGPKEKHDYNLPHVNPQTEEFCELLHIPNQINAAGIRPGEAPPPQQQYIPPHAGPSSSPTPMDRGHPQRPGGFHARPSRPPRRNMHQPPHDAGGPHFHHHHPNRRPPMNLPPPNSGSQWQGRPPSMNLPPPTQAGQPSHPSFRSAMNLPPPKQPGESSQPPLRSPMNLPPPTGGTGGLPQLPRRPMNLPPPSNQP